MGIAQKEAGEVIYWLKLLKETEYLTEKEFDPTISDANELFRIIRSIIISAKKSIQ